MYLNIARYCKLNTKIIFNKNGLAAFFDNYVIPSSSNTAQYS